MFLSFARHPQNSKESNSVFGWEPDLCVWKNRIWILFIALTTAVECRASSDRKGAGDSSRVWGVGQGRRAQRKRNEVGGERKMSRDQVQRQLYSLAIVSLK
ncbi:hypothetical protein CEXT_505231 [Caerostris extrusa]|uniref:Uncharacterized protein n=1 Tax=Caerostris extrusa TaxID=172846 RepID=A0AAV4MUS9_CAEEX|nr:hypothetical protein CEXT_505231 [Caerostris extrusa]